MRLLPLTALALVTIMTTPADGVDKKRPMQVEDLFKFKRVADPQISPDGKQVVYVRMTPDIKTDRSRPSLWLIDAGGGHEMPLGSPDTAGTTPRWSPDGSRIAYVGQRAYMVGILDHRTFQQGETLVILEPDFQKQEAAIAEDGRIIAADR